MKKILIILIVFAGIFNACESIEDDFLNTPNPSSIDEQLIFTTPFLTKGAIDAILEPIGQTNSYRGRYIPLFGINTDLEIHKDTGKPTDDDANCSNYDTDATNGRMNSTNNVWAQMYAGIQRANVAIEALRKHADPQPGSELGHYLGEALTYRSFYYADLLKTWGDVQARFEPVNTETVFLPKTNRDEIYKQILEDLGEAATLVDWPATSTFTASSERVNKAFVKGLRARVALQASGFQQWPDGGGVGVTRRSNDTDLSVANMYQLAFDEVTDVIKSGTASLEPSFQTFWMNVSQERVEAGRESLWEIPFASGRGRVAYTYGVKHNSANQHTQLAKGREIQPVPHLFYDYDEADTRRSVTCVPYHYESDSDSDGFAAQELASADNWSFGKYRFEWLSSIRRVTSGNDDGMNWVYMRYAEILLMAAETANELNGPAAAAPYLKELRRRAFPADLHAEKVDAYVDALGSKEEMFNAIMDEHKFEFAGEALRKPALIRWGLLGTNIDIAIDKMTNLMMREGEYADVPTTLYARLLDDNETLEIYGLNRGETNPGPEYDISEDWVSINERWFDLYVNDPDTRQFWPIWQTFIDKSNGLLVNDYGY